MGEDIVSVLSLSLCIAAFVLSFSAYWRLFRKRMRSKPDTSQEKPILLSEKARVVNKRSEIKYDSLNPKYPHHKMVFYAEFMTGDGEAKEYEIDEKTYSEISEGDVNDLVTENGSFYCFGGGEQIE